ncbi:MAG: cytochrome d ubiquinol oxidase subunit II [Bryobacteraceae bacterium]|nr:cytochrome d ubiquinol oxidase subunit II [Bryobacterales bacterium]MEB2364070.1 cytochrome d ubiquinol oxidase subunit II [Bryobacterales bacterium]NUN02469.1 cytochrome d ubiquinol oxidase subunit II [Bryobacteraceae bacterium]
MDLNAIWFLLLGVLLAGYAVLDGFDFGVGILHPLARTEREKRLFINSIGPIWDGNEVWLITFGGALFAAFPIAYASVFSGFYIAFMALLFALIFRAVSIEFRSKRPSAVWQRAWDTGFFLSSLIASLLFGVAVGNSMIGIPLDETGEFTGSFFGLLGPYPLVAGLVATAMFAMHGSLYLYLKLPAGEARERVRGWMWHTWGIFLVLYILGTMYTLVAIPRATANFEHFPWAAGIVVLNVLAIANIPRSIHAGKPGQAFLSSSTAIICLVVLFGVALWPNLVTASNNPAHSLTIYNAASSAGTLWTMFLIACIGMPFVLSYTAAVYWTFRGEVELGEHSY